VTAFLQRHLLAANNLKVMDMQVLAAAAAHQQHLTHQ
jgi:hypothetical protein